MQEQELFDHEEQEEYDGEDPDTEILQGMYETYDA